MRTAFLAAVLILAAGSLPTAQSDLDAFMAQALERREANWKAQQQYVLDERTAEDIRGPNGAVLWGEEREYTWFIREGVFIRSPLTANGVSIGEAERRTAEDAYLKGEKAREERAAKSRQGGDRPEPPAEDAAGADLDAVLRQTRSPGFANFLRFKFDGGRYALVGRETLDGREVLQIEYYPTNLFSDDDVAGGRGEDRRSDRQRAYDEVLLRALNKASKVTLWIEPEHHQILKYTFDDLDWGFVPGQWLLRINRVQATMSMREAFPDVWLPARLEMHVQVSTAAGPVAVRGNADYHDYRLPSVETTILPGVP
jgi:hypothetical protein